MNNAYGFESPGDLQRVARGALLAEEFSRRVAPFNAPEFHTATNTPQVYVKITGRAYTADRRAVYPAEFMVRYLQAADKTDDWLSVKNDLKQTSGNDVVVITPNGEALKKNAYYEGRVYGTWTCQDPTSLDPTKTATVTVVMADLSDANEIVRVTSTTPDATTGFYPGYLLESDTFNSATLVDGEAVWVRNYGEGSVATKKYIAAFISRWLPAGSGSTDPGRAVYGVAVDGGGGQDCSSCAWLADVPTDDATIRPDMLIQTRGGSGRCSCIKTEGEIDPNEGTRAKWDSVTSTWKSYKGVSLCCGCGDATFAITDVDALTATLTLSNFLSCQTPVGSGACPDPVTVALKQACCGVDSLGRPFVEFFGKGPDPCSGDRERCDNTYRVRVVCVEAVCDEGKTGCAACVEGEGPGAWVIDASGFTNCFAAYNGKWRATAPTSGGGCTWTAQCGTADGVTVTVDVSCLDVTVTFAGAAGGTVVYKYTSDDGTGLHCFQSKTLARFSGDTTDTPLNVTASPLSCERPCTETLYVSSSGALPCSTCDGSSPTTWTSQLMAPFAGYLAATLGGGGVTADCVCDGVAGRGSCRGFGVIVRCNGDGTFTVGPYCASQVGCETLIACYAGPSQSVTVVNEATTPGDVLFSVTFTVDNPDCPEGATEVTLTFSNTP